MTVEQHEGIRLFGAWDRHDGDGRLEPPFDEIGSERRRLAAFGGFDQLEAVGIVDSDHSDLRLAREVAQVRRPPDRGADSPVRVLPGIHGNHAERAAGLEMRDFAWHSEAFGDDELSVQVDIFTANQVAGEQFIGAARITRRRVGELGGASIRVGDAHGHGLGVERRIADGDRRLSGEAQEDFWIVDFDRDVVLPQAGDDFVAGGADVVRMLAAQGREALDEGPRLVERDVGEGGRDFRGQHQGRRRVIGQAGRRAGGPAAKAQSQLAAVAGGVKVETRDWPSPEPQWMRRVGSAALPQGQAMGSEQFRKLVVLGSILLPGALQAQVELRGRVLTESGAPIPGATITLTNIGYSVRSDSLGEFRLSGQSGSTIAISLRAAGYRDDTASVVLARRGSLTRDFTLGSADVAPPEANPSDRILRGLVQDESGQPLSYANIQLNFGRRFMADDSGRFQVPYPGTGTATVIIRRIGFEPAELSLREMPDTALRVQLKTIPTELKGVVVTGASAFRSLDIHGFYQRMKDADRGINHGYFITPEDLEKRKPAYITSMTEGFPTIRVAGRVPRAYVILGSMGCKMTVYLDNIRIVGKVGGTDDFINEIVSPTHVAAMEIYPRGINAPPAYQMSNGTCGVVLIWTK
jgi:hypothetical protein